MSNFYTIDEVAKHNTSNDCYMIIENLVFDMTKFKDIHPGGKVVLEDYYGKDITQVFYSLHRSDVVDKYKNKLVIGKIKDRPEYLSKSGTIRTTPFSEHMVYFGYYSPYYKESHMEYQKYLRKWFSINIKEEAELFEELEKPPSNETWDKLGKEGILLAKLGPTEIMKHLSTTLNLNLPNNIPLKEYDYFHELITHFESAYIGTLSYCEGFCDGYNIGCYPISMFAKKEVKDKVLPELVLGHKKVCLAITEAFAGSDVANIQTVAEISSCGNYFYVTGTKKWITNGTFADYFVTAAKTKNNNKITLFLIERSEGLKTKNIKTSGSSSAGTSYVTFNRVKVPANHILGEEHKGFQVIMYNFNHERWYICIFILALARGIADDMFNYIEVRKVFGKKLSEQPVIREKIAKITALFESCNAWIENITYQMNNLEYFSAQIKLASHIALCKAYITKCCQESSNEVCQIMGGRAITRNGMGKYVERNQRTYKFGAILGGSEEIMNELGVRMALKFNHYIAKL